MELLAGVVGGLGLFIVGMWFLTENLKKLASRRLRRNAQRWTTNPLAALFWGLLGGGITQSMSALTFIAVSILRSRLITLKGALAMILGGGVGVTGLVMIATFDIKMLALYVVGIAGARGGHREALKISGHRGVFSRRGHGHPRPGACQGGCGAACRRALVPGLDAGNRELNGSCLFRRGPADVHRAVLWRGLRFWDQPGGGRYHLRRPGHHDHLWQLYRLKRDHLRAVRQSERPLAPARHVYGDPQSAGLCGDHPFALRRSLSRRAVDEGVDLCDRLRSKPAIGPRVPDPVRGSRADHARRTGGFEPDSREAVAGLGDRRALAYRVHPRPCLGGRGDLPDVGRPRAEARVQNAVRVLRAGAAEQGCRPASGCVPDGTV